jgi:cytochrome c peroxidase
LIFSGCGESECRSALCAFDDRELSLLSSLADLGPPPPDPSNKYLGNKAAIALGKRLYFDTGFSGKASLKDPLGRTVPYARPEKDGRTEISCATCHDLAQGGSDHSSSPNHISIGTGWSAVNALPTLNAAYYPLQFWNGRSDSLWGMIIPVVEGGPPMNGDRISIARRMYSEYGAEYAELFPGYPNPIAAAPADFPAKGKPSDGPCMPDEPPVYECLDDEVKMAITRVAVNYAKAIAAYEYELVTKSSPFDRYMKDGDPISASAIRGARLFVGKAACVDCHRGPMFTDFQFHNTGVAQAGQGIPTEADCVVEKCDCRDPKSSSCIPWGRFDGASRLEKDKFRRDSSWSDDKDVESRRAYYPAPDDSMKGAWRTPTLRDVALTAPYMHDGIYSTLEEVIEHYNRGGSPLAVAPENKDVRMQPLHLEPDEIADLVAFLVTLTSDPLPKELLPE